MLTEWVPEQIEEISDGEALHQLLYKSDTDLTPREWCQKSTHVILEKAVSYLIECLEKKEGNPKTINLVDFGSGSGFVIIELIKELEGTYFFQLCEQHNVLVRFYLLDFPSIWFAKGYQLLNQYPFVHFYSLKDLQTGKIYSVRDFFIQDSIDLILSSMVFHLLPLKTLAETFEDFAFILKKEGHLLWTSPDIGPTAPGSFLLHDPNRQLRMVMLELLKGQSDSHSASFIKKNYKPVSEKLYQLGCLFADEELKNKQALANCQILAVPNTTQILSYLLKPHFFGEIQYLTALMTEKDSIDLILLPSNYKNYLAEISDEEDCIKIIRLFMREAILPNFYQQKRQFNLHWTVGDFVRK